MRAATKAAEASLAAHGKGASSAAYKCQTAELAALKRHFTLLEKEVASGEANLASHDHATTRPRDHMITRPHVTRPHDHTTTRPHDHETTRPRDHMITRPHVYATT